ncbi:MAG: Exopolyphosphatase [Peltula sp. TS41687]|nr:MAG: Exopolyphosphatase [Peltula sp. TS41687]
MPRQPLRQFLLLGKSTIQKAIRESQMITFVIGNEAADLDSLASSILFAYICSSVPRPGWRPGTTNAVYVPILNIPAADVRLRPEFLALLPHTDVHPSDLITLDDLPPVSELPKKLKPENARWILVDHNVLQGRLGEIYGSRVFGVIDHHEDEFVVPKTEGEPRLVRNSGSCASLVAQVCWRDWERLIASEEELAQHGMIAKAHVADKRRWDAQLAKLALAAILIDTANLTMKLTQYDIAAMQYLTVKIANSAFSAIRYRRNAFYGELRAAKEHLDGLEMRDILRKDYKEWTEKNQKKVGISSVVKSLSWQMEHAESETPRCDDGDKYGNVFLDSCHNHARSRNLSVFAIMTAFTESDGRLQRELLIWVLDPDCADHMKEFIQANKEELGLEHWRERHLMVPKEERDRIIVWKQKDVLKSRKQVAPLLRQSMNNA